MLWSSINNKFKHLIKIILTYTAFELVVVESLLYTQTIILLSITILLSLFL
jgi:hypothetical protein